jgi:hypothetical protein
MPELYLALLKKATRQPTGGFHETVRATGGKLRYPHCGRYTLRRKVAQADYRRAKH